MNSNKLKILLLAPDSNPNSVTGALIGYSHGEALSRLHKLTIVIKARNEEAVRRAMGGFHSVESIHPSLIERLYAWMFKRVFKSNYGSLLYAAISFPLPIVFELCAWRQLRARIFAGEFDVVLRILPIKTNAASPFAYFLRKGPIPFVIGPLNGGLPWPKGFKQLDRQLPAASFWASSVRSLYRFLPFVRSTYKYATAIISGSSHTCTEMARYREKVFYVPGDNAVKTSWIQARQVSITESTEKLKLIMVNRLVSLKASDIALRGAASLLCEGRACLSILGEGPERRRLENLTDELGVREAVTFFGWLSHSDVLSWLKKSDVLLFPSLREFGGGVVFEALASGVVPVVADFGGPGDIVIDKVGYRIPLTDEHQMALQIGSVLENLATDRDHLEILRQQGMAYAREQLTWDAKAQMVTEILRWVTGNGPKPEMPPPKKGIES